MIYFDACALLKFVKPEKESAALRAWRESLDDDAEFVTSILSELELTRALTRGGVDPRQVPYYRKRALEGIWLHLIRPHHLARAKEYEIRRLGTLDAIHLAMAEPHRENLAALVTYDKELTNAAGGLGIPVAAPA